MIGSRTQTASAIQRAASLANRTANSDLRLLRRLLRAKDHMDAAPQDDRPVARLARVSGTSQAYFARSFRAAFGVPPHRYLLSRRVERAAALLRDTDLPIIEITLQTGWNSLGTFGRTFRDVTGESPGDLRRRTRRCAGDLDQIPHCFVSAAQPGGRHRERLPLIRRAVPRAPLKIAGMRSLPYRQLLFIIHSRAVVEATSLSDIWG